MTKLTTPQIKALTRAASNSGLVSDYIDNITTLRNLEKAGLLEMISYRLYALTEAGCAAVGRSDDWLLINAMVCERKLQLLSLPPNVGHIDWFINRFHPEPTLEPRWTGHLDYQVSQVMIYQQAAIELTRAELRAGLV